jgi:hypothetical protein
MTNHPDEKPDEQSLQPDSRKEENKEELPRKRRIRVKKRYRQRVRIKKKPSLKRRLKKIMNYVAWIIVLGGFFATVYVLIRELDIKDENAKKKAPKKKQSSESVNNKPDDLLFSMNKHQNFFTVG